jgi:UDP-N-acetylmuramyl pentapeptide phosphotransferase/UDP-N-acetylglucosamine-1-phosphate transferase
VAGGLALLPAFAVAGLPGLLLLVAGIALTVLIWPLLARYALARPNARSSHSVPTPQGGGVTVVAVALVGWLWLRGGSGIDAATAALIGGAVLLAIVGAWDDIRPMPVLPRLALQALAVAAVILSAPGDWRLLPGDPPLWLERAFFVFCGLWFVNLTNFVDGIDGITVANFAPLAGGVVLLSLGGHANPGHAALAAAFLCGLLAFLPFNLPRARLFLGDLGSLPIGLIGGALLYGVAVHAGVAVALLLALYPITDATVTLLRRLVRGARVWEAHREHAYQAGTAARPVAAVVAQVLALNVVLVLLALWLAPRPDPLLHAAGLGIGLLLTIGLMTYFKRSQRAGKRA